jgi:hypothetical protein
VVEDYYGPCGSSIKQVENFINVVPVEVQRSFDHILEECTSRPLLKLKDKWSMKSKPREDDEQFKKQPLTEIDLLLNEFSHLELTGNSLFIKTVNFVDFTCLEEMILCQDS